MHGKLTSVKPAALQKKREVRNAVALDSEQNPVQKDDVVKVIDALIHLSTTQDHILEPASGLIY